ncbi:short chain dehydrogenase [Neptunomonas japonica]|uniref:short chain dehydrogenase n=1 Tax=Neptunomonas japonica TaxID=417574 RepID=UPI000401CE58|nr:short chain dehydrogenase [Neptunomonas japonica]
MKVLIIGASGTIGSNVADALSSEHEIIRANYNSGDVQVDIGNPESISAMFTKIGNVDAVISTAGLANFAPLDALQDSDYQLALNNKLMGQVNLVRIGKAFINQEGSITLTSGILSRQPMPGSTAISMANGALESFAKAAALETENFRVNIVAPAFVKETMEMMGMDSAYGVSAKDTAKAYVAAVTGSDHGKTLDVPDYV